MWEICYLRFLVPEEKMTRRREEEKKQARRGRIDAREGGDTRLLSLGNNRTHADYPGSLGSGERKTRRKERTGVGKSDRRK